MFLDPAVSGLIPSIPQKISEEIIVAVAEVNQLRCFEESEQWLENVDRTHLLLASGKLLQQKSFASKSFSQLISFIFQPKCFHRNENICQSPAVAAGSANIYQIHRKAKYGVVFLKPFKLTFQRRRFFC